MHSNQRLYKIFLSVPKKVNAKEENHGGNI
jgi:hypothetical protein